MLLHQKVIDNAESASDQEVKAGSQTVTVGAVDDALQNNLQHKLMLKIN
jgi:hypothetical protein